MGPNKEHGLTRRSLVKCAVAGGLVTISRAGLGQGNSRVALGLAQILNRIKFSEIPSTPVSYAKMILASTLASAAAGRDIGSVRIIRDLAKEQGGKPEAPIWFDGTKLPINQAARVNSMLSDAAASDDSDLRNVAHTGTCLTSTGLAIGERVGATGQDILSAMVAGYEAAGRIGASLGGG